MEIRYPPKGLVYQLSTDKKKGVLWGLAIMEWLYHDSGSTILAAKWLMERFGLKDRSPHKDFEVRIGNFRSSNDEIRIIERIGTPKLISDYSIKDELAAIAKRIKEAFKIDGVYVSSYDAGIILDRLAQWIKTAEGSKFTQEKIPWMKLTSSNQWIAALKVKGVKGTVLVDDTGYTYRGDTEEDLENFVEVSSPFMNVCDSCGEVAGCVERRENGQMLCNKCANELGLYVDYVCGEVECVLSDCVNAFGSTDEDDEDLAF